MQSLGGLDFDENLVVDDHVHHLRRERHATKVNSHCHLSIDAVARLGQKDFQRSRVDELSISEAEFLMKSSISREGQRILPGNTSISIPVDRKYLVTAPPSIPL